MIIQHEIVSEIIRKIAKQEILPRFKNLSKSDVNTKTHLEDLVTIADLAAEKELTRLLTEALPNSLVIGEEAVANDLSILNRFNQDEPVWTIDPIDGTYNFVHGKEQFGVIISLNQNNETLQSWLYDPIKDKMVYSIKGQGTFVNDKRLNVNEYKPLSNIILQHGSPNKKKTLAMKEKVKEVRRVRSCLHDALDILTGEVDAVLWHRLTPWDNAACVLAIFEAGGYVRLHNGQEYTPDIYKDEITFATSNNKAWEELNNSY